MTIREADWTSLVYAVDQGMCTLMLEPEAVRGELNGQHLTGHVAMANYVKSHLIEQDGLRPEFLRLDPTSPST